MSNILQSGNEFAERVAVDFSGCGNGKGRAVQYDHIDYAVDTFDACLRRNSFSLDRTDCQEFTFKAVGGSWYVYDVLDDNGDIVGQAQLLTYPGSDDGVCVTGILEWS